MKDIQLSKHFKLSEFIRSGKATALRIDNTPGSTGTPSAIEVISNLQYLCTHCLEPLREQFNTPIIITSGYRCPKLNSAVKGVSTSNHLYGYAADIRIPDNETGKRWLVWMMDNLQFDELITEREHANSPTFWIHIAIRQGATNRQRVVQNHIKNK